MRENLSNDGLTTVDSISENIMFSLSGKKAVILGGTSGIGRAVANNFRSAGAEVVLTGRAATPPESTLENTTYLSCDVSNESSVIKVLEAASGALGGLDILVINAGIADDEGSIESYASEAMEHVSNVNFRGAFYALKYAPKYVSDGASIIYTGSVAGSGVTHAGAGVYAASKAAGAYLARTSAIENAPRGIRVNCVCPALIADTGMMVPDDGNDMAVFLSQLNAMGRMGRQNEVVGLYNFLASDASTFITGQEIRVDGGMTAGIGLPIFGALAGE